MLYYNCSKGRGKEWSERYPRKKINQKKVRKPLDKPHGMWYNKSVKREKAPGGVRPIQADRKKGDKKKWSRPPTKKIKKLEKPLDKLPSLWYNKYVSEREFSTSHKPCRY